MNRSNRRGFARGAARVLFVLAFGAAGASADAVAARDTVVLLGNVAGSQDVETPSAREGRATYAYSDRGRGEELVVRWTLDAAGVPVEYVAAGKDYMKAPVNERFTRRGARVEWSTGGATTTQRTQVAPAFYLPTNAPPEFAGVLARALLHAKDRRLPLLPDGEARIEPVELPAEDRVGVPPELRLYRIVGLTYSPMPVWLEPDGTTAAVASGWLSAVQQRHAERLPQLLAAQSRGEARRNAELARTLAHAPAGDLLIRNARLFDPRDLSVTPGTSVLVRGERIVRVAPDAALAASPGAEVVDAGGGTLLPGLWDNHQHLGEADGMLDLLAGVTSARDMANNTDDFLERVARYDAGTEIGPHVFRAGIIDGTGQYAGPTKMRAATLEQALEHVDWYAKHGYGQIKIYSSIDPKWVAPIADAAHARGMRVSGHVPAFMSAEQFIAAGVDEIQHLNFVVLNFLFDTVKDTRNRTRFTAVGENVAAMRPNEPRVAAFIDEMKRHRVVLDPTVNIFEGMFNGRPDALAPALERVGPRLPPLVRLQSRSGALPVPPLYRDAYAAAFPAMLTLLKALHDGGVTLLPGTDAPAGFALQRELELWVRAGIPAAEALRAATLTSAQVSGADHDRGVVAPGRRADLLLVAGDPTQDIGAIRDVRIVVKSGRVYRPAELEAALGIAPAK